MILGFKQLFEDRTPTFFEEKILSGVGLMPLHELAGNMKIHSMREGCRWNSGMPIQMAYGVRTKHYRQFNKGIERLSTCISTQNVFMTLGHVLEIVVDDRELMRSEVNMLILNDGLTYEEFIKWFFPKTAFMWKGQIIHWTYFKY